MSYQTSTVSTFLLSVGQSFAVRTQISDGAKVNVYGAIGPVEAIVPDASSKLFGPYTEPKTVIITALYGTIEYDYGASVSLPAFTYSTPQTEGSGDQLKYALGFREKPDGQTEVGKTTKRAILNSGIPSTITTKVRSAIAAARNNNAVDNVPWFKPPAWTNGSKNYVKGQVVTGSDGVNSYICKVGGVGAAAGTGPSGAGYAAIIDNAVTWYWNGPARGLSNTPGSPFCRVADLTAWTTALPAPRQQISPTLANPRGLYSGGLAYYSGGEVDIRGPNGGTAAAPTFVGTPSSASLAFYTNSSIIALTSANFIYPGAGLQVEIDDRRYDDSGVYNATGGLLGNPGAYLFDTSFAGVGKMKKIRIFARDGFQITCRAIQIESSATLIYPENSNRVKIAVEGDSLTQGGNETPYNGGLDWVSQAMTRLGVDDFANFAVGGTGFVSDKLGLGTTYIQRLPYLAALNADVYYIAGNHNDSDFTSAARQSAVLAYLRALRGLQPNARIILGGNNLLQGGSGAPGQPQYLAEQDLFAAFQAFNDDNSVWAPILTSAAGAWITGTGNAASPANNGNKDRYYDGVIDGHPIQRGVDYFAQRYTALLEVALTTA